MHELSIAKNIIDIISEQLKPDELPRVLSVNLRIGEMAGIVPDALEFSFQVIAADSNLGNAALKIEQVPITGSCKSCGLASTLQYGLFACPHCGSYDMEMLTGTELQIVDVVISDPMEQST